MPCLLVQHACRAGGRPGVDLIEAYLGCIKGLCKREQLQVQLRSMQVSMGLKGFSCSSGLCGSLLSCPDEMNVCAAHKRPGKDMEWGKYSEESYYPTAGEAPKAAASAAQVHYSPDKTKAN